MLLSFKLLVSFFIKAVYQEKGFVIIRNQILIKITERNRKKIKFIYLLVRG